jgi:hypothetical protein
LQRNERWIRVWGLVWGLGPHTNRGGNTAVVCVYTLVEVYRIAL